jgi:hypothetical protein
MGPVNWLAVILAANLAVAVGIVWYGPLFRSGRPLLEGAGPDAERPARNYGISVVVMLMAAWLMGHNFARVGAATLSAKPWLYWMMSGGFAVFLTVPVLYMGLARHGVSQRDRLVDCGFWLTAFLTMGTVFWLMG